VPEIAQYYRPYWDTQPEYRFDPYVATQSRSPSRPLVVLPQTLSEMTGPLIGREFLKAGDNDLTAHGNGQPIGQRIFVSGRVTDQNGRPVRNALIEIWQANSAGRYQHKRDDWDAPLDDNFFGAGRTLTDDDGRYQFLTIRPGAYPWKNHFNAWRPAHIHFSLFGNAYATRLVTQMYFPGDDMLPFDPIFNSIPDDKARRGLIASYDWGGTKPNWAQAFRFDIVLRGRDSTAWE
jgi:protocatechuate 3,4-dioxygenase beta subunit